MFHDALLYNMFQNFTGYRRVKLAGNLMVYFCRTEYTENLTESEKRKLRKQAKHYVSKVDF
jgi:hypothetical protein